MHLRGLLHPALRLTFVLQILVALSAHGAVTYHVATDGDPAATGTDPATPTTLGAALGRSAGGDTLLAAAGHYGLDATLVIAGGITLISTNGPEATSLYSTRCATSNQGKYHVLTVNHAAALVAGFTISNGYNNVLNVPCGVQLDYGVVSNCVITLNTDFRQASTRSAYGGGVRVYNTGRLTHSRVVGNILYETSLGAGVYLNGNGAVVENCLIAGNRQIAVNPNYGASGGGVYLAASTATLRNCTIAGNIAYQGGGVHALGGIIENCIIVGNTSIASMAQPDWLFSGTSYRAYHNLLSSTNGLPSTSLGNRVGTPVFENAPAGDFRLAAGSPGIDTGTNRAGVVFAATDLTGAPRVAGGTVDIGACERAVPAGLACSFNLAPASGVDPLSVVFNAFVEGTETNPAALNYAWDFDDNGVDDLSGTGRMTVTNVYGLGVHSVKLTVSGEGEGPAAFTQLQSVSVGRPTVHVVPGGSGHVPAHPYVSWETAATNLQTAIDAAADGATVLLGAGHYPVAAEVNVSRPLTVRGFAGRTATSVYRNKTGNYRIFYINHPGARLCGLAISNGYFGAQNTGAGVMVQDGGTVSNCLIGGNYALGRGAGVFLNHNGRLTHSLVLNNVLGRGTGETMGGAGVFIKEASSVVENCLIAHNRHNLLYTETDYTYGGGVHLRAGTLRNCTITANFANHTKGGGLYKAGGTVVNCIIRGNSVRGDPSGREWASSSAATATFSHSAITPLTGVTGAGNREDDPLFTDADADVFTLQLGSPCIDAGTGADGADGVDLADQPRLTGEALDMGCYEFVSSGGPACNPVGSPNKGLAPLDVVLSAGLEGVPEGASPVFRWDLDGNGTFEYDGSQHASVTHRFNAGRHTVRLDVFVEGLGTVSRIRTNLVYAAPPTLHVVPGGGEPVPSFPYATWATAATNIQDAVAAALDGCTVLLADGLYPISETISLDAGIAVRSSGGFEKCVVYNPSTGTRCRLAHLGHPGAVIDGLTLSNGFHTATYGRGGGVLIEIAGTISNSLVTRCAMIFRQAYGAGVCLFNGGLLSRCRILDNGYCSYGGAAIEGGGIHMNAGLVENCLIVGNIADNGGATKAAYGGGIYQSGGVVRNCTIAGNIVSNANKNVAYDGSGGGIYRSGGGVVNCIIRNNLDGVGASADWASTTAAAAKNFSHCNLTPLEGLTGTGNIASDPGFANAATRDFRLDKSSACRNAGIHEAWMSGAMDLWGNPRVDRHEAVDIGAHEVPYIPPETIIILR